MGDNTAETIRAEAFREGAEAMRTHVAATLQGLSKVLSDREIYDISASAYATAAWAVGFIIPPEMPSDETESDEAKK